MFYMHVNWLMFIRVEVEDESEVFVYLRHITIVIFTLQRYNFFTSFFYLSL